jgi:protein-disulfide isomerase
MSDAQKLGILESGTPIWFINGQKISGDMPYEYFENLINNLLK